MPPSNMGLSYVEGIEVQVASVWMSWLGYENCIEWDGATQSLQHHVHFEKMLRSLTYCGAMTALTSVNLWKVSLSSMTVKEDGGEG